MTAEPAPAGDRRAFLSEMPAGPGERRLVAAALAISVLAFCALAPFAQIKLARLPAFIPADEAALALTGLITAVLLFGHATHLRSRPLLVLGAGYLFNALIAVSHALSFPGLFAEGGLLGAGPQTTAWLYMFWHGGFALFVLAYAVQRRVDARPIAPGYAGYATLAAILGASLVVWALTVLATRGHDLLPAIMSDNGYTSAMIGVIGAVWTLIVVALAVLWRDRRRSVLDQWLLVVLCAWLFDVALSAVLDAGRFDLGFYAGRLYGLLATSFVLGVLLVETARLYGHLDAALTAAEARNHELQSSREALAHAQRFEAMGQLTGGVAHEFNNLLTIVMGNLEFILRSAKTEPKLERWARAALNAVERGQRLTGHLLTFGRRQITRPEIVNPNHLIADFEVLLQKAVGERVPIVTRFSYLADPVRLDPAQFKTALLNLVANARDAMPDGGTITIETTNVELTADDTRRDPQVKPGPHVLIAVSDVGTGMTREVIDQAFEPFFTTKDVGSSGLGLSQVYGFMRGAEGHVAIDSAPGRGTTVKLYLPRSIDDAKSPQSDFPPLRSAQHRETVLVVEDDAEVLGIVTEGLKELGYATVAASNAVDALGVLRSDAPIDLLFSDVVMPGGMTGIELAAEARRLRPGVKILLTSGYTALPGALPDDLPLLGKPYRRDELASKLRTAISA
ncbi:MAG: MASE4 domain-containing protein [Proteobacteria bacterium]|nr:MASE4 domain-containing protein [Pseudomonadota bacterium]